MERAATRGRKQLPTSATLCSALNSATKSAKGGYAGGEVKTSGNFVPSTFAGLQLNWTTSEWHHGWTVGAGIEYRVTRNISVGAEDAFVDLSGKNHVGALSGGFITAANQVNHNVQVDLHMVTARVSWLF